MLTEYLFCIGFIRKMKGFDGEFIVSLNPNSRNLSYFKNKVTNLDFLFIDLEGQKIPFRINNIIILSDVDLIVQLADVLYDKVKTYLNRPVYIEKKHLPKTTKDTYDYTDIIGYRVSDKQFGDIGIVEEFTVGARQSLFSINKDGKLILVPAVHEIILKIDKKKKHILIDAPEGLIDMYLND